jgi:ABC-2 type transport system ATP-binding protein
MPPVVQAENLTKRFGPLSALDNVTFSVNPGERVAFLGTNGAGKTTFFNLMLGFLPASRGRAGIFGMPPQGLDPQVKGRLIYISEECSLPAWARPGALMRLFSSLYPRWDAPLMQKLAGEWGVDLDKPVRAMSKGQRRLAELALFLSTGPELLLLDEPFDGLDALMRLRAVEVLLDLHARTGATVFFSSHIVSEADKLSERVIILRQGRVALDSALAGLGRPVGEAFLALHEGA